MKQKHSMGWTIAGTLALVLMASGTVIGVAAGVNQKALLAQQVEQRNAAERASAIARGVKPAAKTGNPISIVSNGPKPVRAGGIQDIRQGPVPSVEFAVRNQWSGPARGSGDTRWLVFAGAKGQGPGAPGLPAVYVETSRLTPDGYNFQAGFVGVFTAPNADSPLQIVSVSGDVIVLRTESGHLYRFNLNTRQYE